MGKKYFSEYFVYTGNFSSDYKYLNPRLKLINLKTKTDKSLLYSTFLNLLTIN